MTLKQTIASVVFLCLLALGSSIKVNAQTATVPAINQVNSADNKQLDVLPLSSKSPAPKAANSDPTPPSTSSDQWHFQFTPYLWVAGVSGRGGIGTLSVNVESSITDDNVHLNFGFMGTFEAHRNKLSIVTDLQYSSLGTERPTPGILFSNASADFKTFIIDPEVGYRIAANPEKGRFIDLLGGVRYWHLRADLNFDAGLLSARSATGSKDWADGVIGLRGRAAISKRVFVLGKADIGGGGSKFTYQLFGGVGIGLGKRTSLIGGYRDLHVNYDKGNFLFDMSLAGPIFGVSFRLGK